MSYSIDTSDKFIRITYEGTLDIKDIEGVLGDAQIIDSKELNLTNRIEDMRNLIGLK